MQDGPSGPATALWKGGLAAGDKSVNYQYAADGAPKRVSRHGDAVFGNEQAFTTFEYHGDGRPEEINHQRAGSPGPSILASYESQFDSRGLLVERHTIFNSSGYTSSGNIHPDGVFVLERKDQELEYDAGGQLTRIGDQDPPYTHNVDWQDPMAYDNSGHYQPDQAVIGWGGRLIQDGDARYRYDAEGHLVQVVAGDLLTTYQWDARGRLLSVEKRNTATGTNISLTYLSYDALGRLIAMRREVPDEPEMRRHFVVVGSARVLELDADDNEIVQSSFLGAGGEVLAVDRGGTTAWAFADLAGTVRTYASVDGSGVWQVLLRRFQEFGQPRVYLGNALSLKDWPSIWHGVEHMEDVGYQLSGRWYNGNTHRFLADGGALRGYRLGNNNPTAKDLAAQKPASFDFGYAASLYREYVNPINDFRAGRWGWGIGKSIGWAMAAIPAAILAPEAIATGGLFGLNYHIFKNDAIMADDLWNGRMSDPSVMVWNGEYWRGAATSTGIGAWWGNADRGREVRVEPDSPPSEPCMRFSRTRLSS